LDQAYSPPTAGQIQAAALQIVRRHEPARTLGKNWAYDFIARLPPRFETIKQKPMEKARYEVCEPGYLICWYERLQTTLQTYGITPKNLYNFDETGFRIGEGKAQNVVSARGNSKNNTARIQGYSNSESYIFTSVDPIRSPKLISSELFAQLRETTGDRCTNAREFVDRV